MVALDPTFELGEAFAALREIAKLRGCSAPDIHRADAAIELAELALAAHTARVMGVREMPIDRRLYSVRINRPDEPGGGGWLKHVTGIDRAKRHGFAFLGDFLSFGESMLLPVGAIVLAKWQFVDKSISARCWGVSTPRSTGESAITLLRSAEGRRWWADLARFLTPVLP